MPPRKPPKCALIDWLNTGYCDIIPLTKWPKKNPKVDDILELLWLNHETSERKKFPAKILAIGEERELRKLVVTSTKEIVQPTNKIFSTEIMGKKKLADKQKSFVKSIKSSNKNQMNEQIKAQKPLFPTTSNFPNRSTSEEEISKQHVSSEQFQRVKFEFQPNQQCRTSLNGSHERIDETQAGSNCSENMHRPPINSNLNLQYNQQYWTTLNERIADTQAESSGSENMHRPPMNSSLSFGEHRNDAPYPRISQSFSESTGVQRPIFSQYKTGPSFEQPTRNISTSCSGTSSAPSDNGFNKQENAKNRFRAEEKICSTQTGFNDLTKNAKKGLELCNGNEDDTSSNSSSDSEMDISDEAVKKFSNELPFKVKRSNIHFLEFFLGAMKHQYEIRKKMKYQAVNKFTIPLGHFQPGPDMAEIYPGCGFYLEKKKINYINVAAHKNGPCKWEEIVKITLVEVFNKNLKYFSACGVRSSRPGIDYRLINGLHGWVNEFSKEAVTSADLNIYINKCINNKRKNSSKTLSEKESVKASKEKVPTIPTIEEVDVTNEEDERTEINDGNALTNTEERPEIKNPKPTEGLTYLQNGSSQERNFDNFDNYDNYDNYDDYSSRWFFK